MKKLRQATNHDRDRLERRNPESFLAKDAPYELIADLESYLLNKKNLSKVNPHG